MIHDVAIIGGGVVGCALLRRFALGGVSVILLEKGTDILSGASKANSAILHTGFDAIPGSLEQACVQAGHTEYLQIHEKLNLPLLQTGAMVVAWNAEQDSRLHGVVETAGANGVDDVEWIDAPAVYARAPNLGAGATGAVWVPRESVIDPWSAPLAYARQAIAHGASLHRGAEVTGGEFDGATWRLRTAAGEVRARVVINAAGNHGDRVEAICRPSPFAIRPRKGQFVVFDKPAAALLEPIILPAPTERTKGVLICRTAFGNLLVGPTAEDQDDRDVATVEEEALAALIERARQLLPALAEHSVTAVYAGLRPATQFKDYQIEAVPARRWIAVGGIRSTGLSGALGIARYVAHLYGRHFGELAETTEPVWTPVPNLCEYRPRPWQQTGNGGIVCHCEGVTREEIRAALSGVLPAGDLGGLKRRTRCMMGRCQGFYCSARVAEIATQAAGGAIAGLSLAPLRR